MIPVWSYIFPSSVAKWFKAYAYKSVPPTTKVQMPLWTDSCVREFVSSLSKDQWFSLDTQVFSTVYELTGAIEVKEMWGIKFLYSTSYLLHTKNLYMWYSCESHFKWISHIILIHMKYFINHVNKFASRCTCTDLRKTLVTQIINIVNKTTKFLKFYFTFHL